MSIPTLSYAESPPTQFLMQLHVLCLLINNYSTPKPKLILLNNPWDEVEGIIQQH